MSASDQSALGLLVLLDRNGGGSGWISEFSPVLWGPPAVSHYSAKERGGGSASHLWKVPRASEVLSLIDPEKMARTAAGFPLELPLDPAAKGDEDDNIALLVDDKLR